MPVIENPPSPLVPRLRGLHLFGFDSAPCSQRVSFALAEKGIRRARRVAWSSDRPGDLVAEPGTYVMRPVSLVKKEHLSEAYAAIQPNMVVPALVEDGRLRVESMDIIAHLDALVPEQPLVPTDPDAAALAEELAALGVRLHRAIRFVSFHWGLGRLGKIGGRHRALVRRLERDDSPERLAEFYEGFDGDTIAADTYRGHLRDLEDGWGAQEARLADGRPFLTGDAFSTADIVWAVAMLRIRDCGYPFADRFPALHAWFQRIEARPGFQDGVMRHHRMWGTAFRVKAAVEGLFGLGIDREARPRV